MTHQVGSIGHKTKVFAQQIPAVSIRRPKNSWLKKAMGLFYILPTSEKEVDRVQTPANAGEFFVLKTYGPPLLFWGYLVAILLTIGALGFLVWAPANKLVLTGDVFNIILGHGVKILVLGIPLVSLAFFFYEKHLKKSGNLLIIEHRLFFLPVWTTKINLKSEMPLTIQHFLDSPNMARKRGEQDLRAFYNHGHFNLWAHAEDKTYLLDRSSQKNDLEKIKSLLQQY